MRTLDRIAFNSPRFENQLKYFKWMLRSNDRCVSVHKKIPFRFASVKSEKKGFFFIVDADGESVRAAQRWFWIDSGREFSSSLAWYSEYPITPSVHFYPLCSHSLPFRLVFVQLRKITRRIFFGSNLIKLKNVSTRTLAAAAAANDGVDGNRKKNIFSCSFLPHKMEGWTHNLAVHDDGLHVMADCNRKSLHFDRVLCVRSKFHRRNGEWRRQSENEEKQKNTCFIISSWLKFFIVFFLVFIIIVLCSKHVVVLDCRYVFRSVDFLFLFVSVFIPIISIQCFFFSVVVLVLSFFRCLHPLSNAAANLDLNSARPLTL